MEGNKENQSSLDNLFEAPGPVSNVSAKESWLPSFSRELPGTPRPRKELLRDYQLDKIRRQIETLSTPKRGNAGTENSHLLTKLRQKLETIVDSPTPASITNTPVRKSNSVTSRSRRTAVKHLSLSYLQDTPAEGEGNKLLLLSLARCNAAMMQGNVELAESRLDKIEASPPEQFGGVDIKTVAAYWITRARLEESKGNNSEVIRCFETASSHNAQPIEAIQKGLRNFMTRILSTASVTQDLISDAISQVDKRIVPLEPEMVSEEELGHLTELVGGLSFPNTPGAEAENQPLPKTDFSATEFVPLEEVIAPKTRRTPKTPKTPLARLRRQKGLMSSPAFARTPAGRIQASPESLVENDSMQTPSFRPTDEPEQETLSTIPGTPVFRCRKGFESSPAFARSKASRIQKKVKENAELPIRQPIARSLFTDCEAEEPSVSFPVQDESMEDEEEAVPTVSKTSVDMNLPSEIVLPRGNSQFGRYDTVCYTPKRTPRNQKASDESVVLTMTPVRRSRRLASKNGDEPKKIGFKSNNNLL